MNADDKKYNDRIARLVQDRVLAENKPRETLLHEMAGAVLGTPLNWSNAGTAAGSSIARAVDEEGRPIQAVASYVCGQCKKFNVETGRKQIIAQRFAERLVRDQRWQLHHLGVPLDSVGLCDESNGTLATTVVSPAIDKYTGKMCPGFRPK